MKIIVGSRASKLALAQTEIVINKLKWLYPNITFEIKEIVTTGDKILDISLDKVGGKGLFLKEIEDALLKGEIDIAVHSMKDVPALIPQGLVIACVLEREDSRDCFVSSKFSSFDSLPKGAVVGTSSARRRVQLMFKRPDLEYKVLRGNVLTRLNKVEKGEYDAAILAYAGIKRLGLANKATEIFDKDFLIPAVAQGAICVECRHEDLELIKILSSINHKESEIATSAERAYLKEIAGDCSTPIAAMATLDSKASITLKVWYAGYNAEFQHLCEVRGQNPEQIGLQAAVKIKESLKS